MKWQCRIFKATSEKRSKCVRKILFTPKILYQAFRNLLEEPVTFSHSFTIIYSFNGHLHGIQKLSLFYNHNLIKNMEAPYLLGSHSLAFWYNSISGKLEQFTFLDYSLAKYSISNHYWPRSRLQPRTLGEVAQTLTLSKPSTFITFASQSTLKTIRAKCIMFFIPLHISHHKKPKEPKSSFTTWSLVPGMLSIFPDLVPPLILPQTLKHCHYALCNSQFVNCLYTSLSFLSFKFSSEPTQCRLWYPLPMKMTCQKSPMSSLLLNQWLILILVELQATFKRIDHSLFLKILFNSAPPILVLLELQ